MNCILWIGYRHELYIVNSVHTQTSMQRAFLSSFRGIKRPERVADHSLLCSTETNNEWNYASNPPVPLWLDKQNLTSYSEQGKMRGEKSCGHFLAGALQYKYSQFRFCQFKDSNSVSGVHKLHTSPLISLSPSGDIWPTVWISVVEFCP